MNESPAASMKWCLLLALLGIHLSPLLADPPPGVLGETETKWSGIHYQITFLNRILSDRLLVGVRIVATAKAPAGGTLIGVQIPIPPHANKYDIAAGYYHPRPFSLSSSVMTDDLTQQKYSVLPPIAPPGRKYRLGEVLDTLTPYRNDVLTIQFAVPPPPPSPPAGEPPPKQTVSFLLPEAKGPIEKIPLPPPSAAADPH